MVNLSIPVVLGTAREGRASERVAKFIVSKVKAMGHTPIFVDVREYVASPITQGSMSSKIKAKWSEMVTSADAIVIVSPEYNHSYPGELKLLLDENFKEYAGKPVMFVGVSTGGFGGTRVVELLAQLAVNFGMLPTNAPLNVSEVGGAFDEDGTPIDASYNEKADKALGVLVSYADNCPREAGE